ncbi:MAG: EAL domain-containing protein [Methylobacter sp.]|nr:MAG: EAL domain-containing protein [Methylobacter sp.]
MINFQQLVGAGSLFPLLKQLGLAALYTLLGSIVLSCCSGNGIISVIWLPAGLALSALSIGGNRYACGIFFGALLVNVIAINAFWPALAIAMGNTLEALFGAWLLRRNNIFNRPVLSTRNYLLLLIVGGFASVIAALAGAASLFFFGIPAGKTFFLNLNYWWMGDALGIALITPLILVWRRAPDGGFKPKQLAEFILLFGFAFLLCQMIFMGWLHNSVGHIAKGYWMFLVVTWAAVRLEVHGVVVILLMSAVIGLLGAQQGIGYFATDIIQTYLANYWFFMMILSVTGMTLATYFVARRRAEQTLTASEGYQRAIFNATPDAMLISDKQGIITQVNQQAELLLGYKLGELIGQPIEILVPESFRAKHPEKHAKFVADPVTRPLRTGRTLQARRKDGSSFDVDISVSPIKTEQGLFFASALRDVTRYRQAEAHLRVAAIAFESNEPMVITDAESLILQVNRAFTESTGYTKEEVIGQHINLLKSGRHDEDFYAEMWASIHRDGTWQGEIWDKRKNGEIYPKWLIISVVKGDDGVVSHYVGTHIDITERKAAEEQIKQLAFYDSLTQLPNRRLLQERLKHGIDVERRDGKQLALLMLDLDRFKAVNDSLGHLAGDELLQQVAARITKRLREVDMVARLGGDEFIVLLEDISHPEDAARVAEDIIADLSKLFCVAQGEEVQISASIGISLYPQHGDSPEALMDHADAALYQAKDAGRGCFAYFSEDLTVAARERIALESRLRRAIEQQELRVFYQPQVDIASARIVGAEALVRWQDPVEGLIPPFRFIPIAEETGLIIPIGEWVLRETCRQGRQWLDAGLPPLTLAVNVSPHQFRRSDICDVVAAVLNETGFPAKQLELEITESGLMENQENATDILNCLRGQGIRLAIDDFGTGYSSLAYLKHFPLDLLKIDKSFIDDIPHLQYDMEIAATIIAMGHILGFKVLAEGVETLEQLAFLREKGCDMYQGYIKSRPIPAEEFAELLRNQQRE